tara:strand:- start:447 stop:992 length:546 start_codon:yes stop_codon:yes gene_type:complete
MEIKKEYGYILLIAVLLYLHQQLFLVIPVIKNRQSTGISAPTIYPRDSEISKLQLSNEQVDQYLRAQRAHQNNVELTSVFMPLFLIVGLFEPTQAAIGGVIVLLFRVLGGIGYLHGKRMIGAGFHLGELYILYLACKIGFKFISNSDKTINEMTGGNMNMFSDLSVDHTKFYNGTDLVDSL